MYNRDTELIFPSRVIPALSSLRGKKWKTLVEQIITQQPGEIDHLAFVLLMVRLAGCVNCHADSYRAMRGCTLCAKQAVKRFRGDDQEMFASFSIAIEQVEQFVANHKEPPPS